MARIESAAYAVNNKKQCVEFESLKRVNSIAHLKLVTNAFKNDNAITSDRIDQNRTDAENQSSPQRA